MYSPSIKAWNYALDQLSKVKVSGLPDFREEHQIVPICSEARCIAAGSYLQGLYKPDVILVQWKGFNAMQKQQKAPYLGSHLSNFCCQTGCYQPKFNWQNLLSTVEVKLGVSVQFLWFQISTFDKVSTPTITHFSGNRGSPPSFPFISLLCTHQKTRQTRWITDRD